jgi:hypothetical protein
MVGLEKLHSEQTRRAHSLDPGYPRSVQPERRAIVAAMLGNWRSVCSTTQ